jgi:hypothetical protein
VAAANRNGVASHGVAFEATILAMDVSSLSCTSAQCGTSFPHMIEAIDYAVKNGVRVINFSAGPGPSWQPTEYYAAMRRAAEAGVVLVFAAGNNGAAQPIPNVKEVERQLRELGNVIIAGAHDGGRQLASFSDRAGDSSSYLTALGVSVATSDNQGYFGPSGGTSFSAPAVAGAVALLAGAFPNLTGKQIVEILFKSADDAGAAGWDSSFGHGILNVGRAFAPIGATRLAGSNLPVSMLRNGRVSEPMGDANMALPRVTVLDSYSRAFATDLGGTIGRPPVEPALGNALAGANYRTVQGAARNIGITLTTRRLVPGEPQSALAGLHLSKKEAEEARAIAGAAITRLPPRTAVALGISQSGRFLQQLLSGNTGASFMVARDPVERLGFHANPGATFAVRQDIGAANVTVMSERGEAKHHAEGPLPDRSRYSIQSVLAGRSRGRLSGWVGASQVEEESTVLGGRFSQAFSSGGSTSYFVDTGFELRLGRGWSAGGTHRRGWTRTKGTGGLLRQGELDTRAFTMDVSKRGSFTSGDTLALRVAQPLRVSSGGFDLSLPISFDHQESRARYASSFLNLSPRGRELDYELAYALRSWRWKLELNSFIRTEPGHFETRRADIGAALRFSSVF